jgi:hypothetical protein
MGKAGRPWRTRFLRAMARTANARLSAQMAGVDHSTAYELRGRDPGFAAAWLRARDWGRARLRAEGRPVLAGGRPRPARPGETADPRELILRRSKREGTQIVRAGEGRWSPSAEADFFAHLAAGFGVAYAARAAGFSTTAVYRRRMNEADFAKRWDMAREEGKARNDGLLIDAVPRALDPEVIATAEGLPRPTIAEAIQIQRLYRKDGEEGDGRRNGWAYRPRRLDEVHGSILAKLAAIERRRDEQRLAEGWTKDESGHWIPPGWVRREGG